MSETNLETTVSDSSKEDRQKLMDENHARLCRKFAVAVATAIAIRNISFDEIGEKVGKKGSVIRRQFLRLIEGRSVALHDISDIVQGCDCEMNFVLGDTHQVTQQSETAQET